MASNSRKVPTASALAVYSGVSKLTWTCALRRKIIDLVRLHCLDKPEQVRASVMSPKCSLNCGLGTCGS